MDAKFLRLRAQESIRFFQQQTTAVARFSVSRDRAAMGQARERLDRCLHQPVTGLIVDVGYQAESAAIFFEAGLVEAG